MPLYGVTSHNQSLELAVSLWSLGRKVLLHVSEKKSGGKLHW